MPIGLMFPLHGSYLTICNKNQWTGFFDTEHGQIQRTLSSIYYGAFAKKSL